MAPANLPSVFNATSQDIEMLLAAQSHLGSKNLQVHMNPYLWKTRYVYEYALALMLDSQALSSRNANNSLTALTVSTLSTSARPGTFNSPTTDHTKIVDLESPGSRSHGRKREQRYGQNF